MELEAARRGSDAGSMATAGLEDNSEQLGCNENVAQGDELGIVHPEHADGRAADGSAADEGAAVKAEMVIPFGVIRCQFNFSRESMMHWGNPVSV